MFALSAVDITVWLALIGVFLIGVGSKLKGNLIPTKDPTLGLSAGARAALRRTTCPDTKRNPDKLNTIGVVVVGICGAVNGVRLPCVALQAFYMNDTADMQANKDYGGMDTTREGHKARRDGANITEAAV